MISVQNMKLFGSVSMGAIAKSEPDFPKSNRDCPWNKIKQPANIR